jgi:uncharacterized protein (DUF427 family)
VVTLPAWAQRGRAQWVNTGAERPPFAIEPGPGQESVFDYPRPPVFVPDARRIEVSAPDGPIASSTATIRALETSQPPAFYLPPDAVVPGRLVPVPGRSLCEWKGEAEYLALAGTTDPIGWRYPDPFPEFAPYTGWVSFYPDRVTCLVDGEVARGQAGGFYGGWITDEVVGPFKGEPGTSGW